MKQGSLRKIPFLIKGNILKKISGFLDYRQKSNRNEEKQNFKIFHNSFALIGFEKSGEILKYGYLTLIFKGVLYNKDYFRKRLKLYGYLFETESSAEIVLKALHKWGEDVVKKFEGSFSFVSYNSLENKIFIFRDKMGIKPFFYYYKDDYFLFADSLRNLLEFEEFDKKIDYNSLALYMRFGYMLEPNTIYENTFKLKAGYYLEIDLKRKLFFEKKYWDLAQLYKMPLLDISEKEAIDTAEELLFDSLNKVASTSSNIGVLLSGGYDSSSIAALVSRVFDKDVHTYTVGFYEKKFDESVYASKVAKEIGSIYHRFLFMPVNMRDTVEDFVNAYDEPFGDKAAFATLFALKKAKSDVDTILAGDGGDEVFGTGDDIEQYRVFNHFPKPIRKFTVKSMSLMESKEIVNKNAFNNFFSKYEKLKNILDSDNIAGMLKHKSQSLTFKEVKEIMLEKNIKDLETNFENRMLYESNDELNNLLAVTIKTYLLDNEIAKTAGSCSYFDLFLKEPYLDDELLAFMARIDTSLKQKNGVKKYILKEIIHKYIPKKIMQRPKQGFSIPFDRWFRKELRDLFLEYINEDRLNEEKIFETNKVIKIRDNFLKGYNEKIVTLWNIFVFELWYERWMR